MRCPTMGEAGLPRQRMALPHGILLSKRCDRKQCNLKYQLVVMTDPSDQPPAKREPLAALHTYEPVPDDEIFPVWEWFLKFGWIGALVVAALVGYRFWKPKTDAPSIPVLRFPSASQWMRDSDLAMAPAISR